MALAALPAPARAATWELSRLKPVGGQMLGMVVAGERLFYQAAYEEDGGVSLYSVPTAGGRPVRLNANLPYGQVHAFQPSADGSQVVFALWQEEAQQAYLYSVPGGGGTPIQLSDPARETITQGYPGRWFPHWVAGDRVVYLASEIWLYSVPITGGPLTLLRPALPADNRNYEVREVQLSADGTRVAYTIYDNGKVMPYTVPVTGGVPQPVHAAAIDFGPSGSGGAFLDLMISADGSRVAYMIPTPDPGDAPENRALVSARSDGGDQRTLASGPSLEFQYHARSGRLVYTTRANWVASIRSVPIGGGATAIISDTARTNLMLSLNPYSDAGLLHDTDELFQFSVVGGAPTPVDLGEMQTGEDYAFTPDGRSMLFTTGPYGQGGILFGYNLASGDLWQIDDPLLASGGVGRFWLAPGGERVVYSARTDTSGAWKDALFSAPVRGGGGAVPISGTPRPNEPLLGWDVVIGPDGSVFYTTGRPIPGSSKAGTYFPQLYRAVITGETAPALIHRSRAIVGAVGNIAVSPIDGRVVYVADQEVDGEFNLYSVPIGGGEPAQIGTSVTYQISPLGGVLVAIEADRASTRHIALTRMPIAGGASERIFTPAGQDTYFSDLELTPDGRYAVFILSEQSVRNLYRVPVAGGAAQLLGEHVEWYLLSPDGAFVVYRSNLADRNQLGVVRVADGATLWSEAIAAYSAIAISPDSARVAFEAAGPSGESAELAIRSLDGSATLIDATDVIELQFTADSRRVVFVTLDTAGGVYTYTVASVPVAGGTPVELVRASGSPPFFAMELAGDRLISHTWHAGSAAGMVEHTLASVPVAGGEPTNLFGPADRPNRTLLFQATPDGSRVLYALHDAAWAVPITGGAATKLIDGAQVERFYLTEDGRVVMLDTGGGLTINRLSGGARRRLNDPLSRVRAVALTGDKAIYTASRKGVSLYASDLLDGLDLGERVHLPLVR